MTFIVWYLIANAGLGALFMSLYSKEYERIVEQDVRKQGIDPEGARFKVCMFLIILLLFIPMGIYTLIKGKR